jgi:hypothetical protein
MDMIGNALHIVVMLLLPYGVWRCARCCWRRSPTLREYLAKHAACKGEGEVGCYRCGAFHPIAAEDLSAVRCKTLCRCCKTVLWRSDF